MMLLWEILFMLVMLSFVQVIHPMMMSICVIFSVLMSIVFFGTFFPSFWLSYVILLVFLGGLLVLFVYISSLSGNEPVFMYSYSGLLIVLVFFSMNLFTDLSVDENYFNNMDLFYCLISVYFSNNLFFIFFLLFYLFFLLLMVTDLTKFMLGPLSMIYEK